jgi:hydroxysqualene synthase
LRFGITLVILLSSFLQNMNSINVAESYDYCERITRAHAESFPVGSLFVPKSRRRHIYSIYAFARTADDIADEGYEDGLNTERRFAALDDWERKLEACYRGQASHPVFIALSATARELHLPLELFRDLLSAFKQDVVKRRYANFGEVLDYCSRSANPVGRLVLLLFDYRDERYHRLADEITTGLQLVNFWQDVAVDILKDRVYLPEDEMKHFGVSSEDLREQRFNRSFAALLKFQVERTKEFLERGSPLPRLLRGRIALEVRLTLLGGMRILEKIEQQGYDTLSSRPKLQNTDKIGLIVKLLTGSR